MMTQQSELHTLAVKVGEISGQLRELIHKQNNMEMKLDGAIERLLTLPTAAEVADLRQRVDALERANDRRDGATGAVAGILKSPAFGWIVGLAATAFAAIKGGLLK